MENCQQQQHILSGGSLDANYMEGCRSFGEYILKKLKEYGDKVLLIDGVTYEETTAAQLRSRSIHFAKALQHSGIDKGDTLFICSEDRMEFAYIVFGAMLLGARVTFVEADYNEDQMCHTIDETRPKIIFCSYTSLAYIKSIISTRTFVQKVCLFGQYWDGQDVISCSDWLYNCNISDANDDDFVCKPVDMKETVAIILRTSGTTKMPKNILVTQTNMMLSSILYKQHPLTPNPIAMSVVAWVRGIGIKMLFKYILNNVPFVFLHRVTEREFLRVIEKYKINIIWNHPKLMATLGQRPLAEKYDISSIRILYSGGAVLTDELEAAVRSRLPNCIIRLIYGMVELSYVAHQTDEHCKRGSVGAIQPGTFGKVIDIQTGRALGPNEMGEACFKGDVVMKGYIGTDENMNRVIDLDGWFHSGDIGYYDTDGDWFLVGRINDLIQYNGVKIAPFEVEKLLLNHSDILDASVVGIESAECGETPVAFVVKRPDAKCTEKDIIDLVAEKTSSKIDLHKVYFVNKLPRSVVGKLLRTFLRKYASDNPTEDAEKISPFYLRWYNENKQQQE